MAALKYAVLALALISAASASRLELNGIPSVCNLACVTFNIVGSTRFTS